MKRELLDNGNIWQKSDGRWIGMGRYKDEYGVTQRKSFSSKKKKTLQAKIPGMWVGENESAKFWATVLNGLKNRGVVDIFIACTDNLTGFSSAIEAV